jgi:hypothetical protein
MATKTQEGKPATMPASDGAGQPEATALKDAAAGVADEAGRTIEKSAARGMSQVGDTLHQVADAVRQSSTSLESEQPQIGRLIETAANKIDEAATYVTDREPMELMDGAQAFARRQPALIIGGGLVAGLLLGRALRSASGQAPVDSSGQDWYGAGHQRSSARSASGTSRVSSGYGTGYGASYDQAATATSGRRGNGSLASGSTANGGSRSDPAEG